MFYRALGRAIWKIAIASLRQRYARTVKITAVLGLASLVAAAAYLASRPSE